MPQFTEPKAFNMKTMWNSILWLQDNGRPTTDTEKLVALGMVLVVVWTLLHIGSGMDGWIIEEIHEAEAAADIY
jgi:hypothetical protein